jgi:hypothetical protein
MTKNQESIAASLTSALLTGTLSEDQLRKSIAQLTDNAKPRRQNILYLQTQNTSPAGQVMGMTLIENGALAEGPSNPDDWPYQNVLDAINDGWRIISFPNMALLAVDEKEFYGLGFEFILERWS